MPARKNQRDEHQFQVGDPVLVTLHTGAILDGTVRAIIERTDGIRLQVDYGKDQTALVALWRGTDEIKGLRGGKCAPARRSPD